jgi:hypothetical protein
MQLIEHDVKPFQDNRQVSPFDIPGIASTGTNGWSVLF